MQIVFVQFRGSKCFCVEATSNFPKFLQFSSLSPISGPDSHNTVTKWFGTGWKINPSELALQPNCLWKQSESKYLAQQKQCGANKNSLSQVEKNRAKKWNKMELSVPVQKLELSGPECTILHASHPSLTYPQCPCLLWHLNRNSSYSFGMVYTKSLYDQNTFVISIIQKYI